MNRNFIILCVCSLFLLQVAFGQSEKSEQRITRNGEEFYVHNVGKKQTLYNISKLYDTSIDSIIAWNPEATEGIKYKQVLYIHIHSWGIGNLFVTVSFILKPLFPILKSIS